ncbi:cupin [Candidatus Daviesbacteria bacterium]|nr:cupin [Candidatus Daviesbacteria bacterium]
MGNDQLGQFLKTVDKSKFTNKPYIKKLEKPWGYELHFVPEGLPYMGKLLHIQAGKRLSLQAHDAKLESWFLLNGQAAVIWENTNGDLVETKMENEVGYTCNLGQKHRLMGITDCGILEVSTPELGNTYRLEDDYARPTETEEMRKDPNRGWK